MGRAETCYFDAYGAENKDLRFLVLVILMPGTMGRAEACCAQSSFAKVKKLKCHGRWRETLCALCPNIRVCFFEALWWCWLPGCEVGSVLAVSKGPKLIPLS